MATSKNTRTCTPRQPATEGPDVIYNGGDWDIYVDARYLGSRSSSQDAWIAARQVHFEQIEDAAVQTADDAAACDPDEDLDEDLDEVERILDKIFGPAPELEPQPQPGDEDEDTTMAELIQVRVRVARFDRDVAGTLGDVMQWSLSKRFCMISTDDVEALFTRLDADDNVLWYETVRDSQV